MFGRKRRKKKSLSTSISDAVGQSVKVRIYRDIGGSVPHLAVEFDAIESKDQFGAMNIVHDKIGFNQEVEFEKDSIIEELGIVLRIAEVTKEEAIKKIEDKIKEQKQKLNHLDTFLELNAIFNYTDEQQRLTYLVVLSNHIKNINEGKGAFFTIENNKRVYSFVRKAGRYFPIWHGVEDFTTYPNYVNKQKIYKLEEEIFRKEWGQYFKENMSVIGSIIVLAILVLLVCAFIFGFFKILDKSENLDQTAQQSALACVEQYNILTTQLGEFIEVHPYGNLLNQSLLDPLEKEDFINDEIKQLGTT